VRLTATDATLDAAVAETRNLLDRIRQGAFREADRARAATSLAHDALGRSLDPRERVIALWRGETATRAPSLDVLQVFAAASLHDDALVIVAARPSRLDAGGHPFSAREREPAPRPTKGSR